MASISWTEPSAFTRAKLDDGSPPQPWWVKFVVFVVLFGGLLAFPLAYERPIKGSWEFTVVLVFATSFLLVFVLPYLVSRSGDQWALTESGVGFSGFRGFMQVGGHWPWTKVTGYRISMREVDGVAHQVLEFYDADGLFLQGALGGRITPDSVAAFLFARGVRVAEAKETDLGTSPVDA